MAPAVLPAETMATETRRLHLQLLATRSQRSAMVEAKPAKLPCRRRLDLSEAAAMVATANLSSVTALPPSAALLATKLAGVAWRRAMLASARARASPRLAPM